MNLKGRVTARNTSAAVSKTTVVTPPRAVQKAKAQTSEYGDNTFQTIDKIETKGARVEFLNTGFDLKKDSSIGKIRINFQKLDDSNHQIAFGSFYLGFDEIYELDEFIQHDLPERYVESKDAAAASGTKFAKPIYTKYAGVVAESGVLSRVLELTPGFKEDLIITYKEGPGNQHPTTKLITPAGKMVKTISVPLSVNRLISIVKSLESEIVAYKASVHVEKRLENKFKDLSDKLDSLLKKCE